MLAKGSSDDGSGDSRYTDLREGGELAPWYILIT